jgi:hypothetical protein
MCARVHVRVRACACPPARLPACPPARPPARPPACPPACPPARLPALASMVWFDQNRHQSRGSGLLRWMTAEGVVESVAGLFCAK